MGERSNTESKCRGSRQQSQFADETNFLCFGHGCHPLMRARGGGGNPCSGCDPLVVGFELHPELVVEDSQIAVAATYDRIRPDRLYFLRHHADIGLVAAVIDKAIESKAIIEMTEQGDVVLECDIRASSAAAASATATASAATAHARATATAASAETRVSA